MPHHDADDLLARLRRRAADPARRTDGRESAFSADVRTMDPGAMARMLQAVQADLARAMASGPEGPPPDVLARAMELGAQMGAPAESGLPGPCAPADLAEAEARLGFTLPPLLRRVLTEVADGGFGPGYGLVGVAGAADAGAHLVELYEGYRAGGDGAIGTWPEGRLPVAHLGEGLFACVDALDPDAPVVVFDPTELDEDDDLGVAFAPEAPSLEAWLADWVASPSLDEQVEAANRAMAADIMAREPVDELDRLRQEWIREQGLA